MIEEEKKEVRENYEAFSKMKFNLAESRKFAILKNKEVIEIFDTKSDAEKTASILYKDNIFSIQQIDPQRFDLGYAGYALHTNTNSK